MYLEDAFGRPITIGPEFDFAVSADQWSIFFNDI